MENKLIVHEIFSSIDGECNYYHQGHITTFIRLAGCNLRCHYCDTKYAQNINEAFEIDFEHLKRRILTIGIKKLTFTGGEPLLQNKELYSFIKNIYNDPRFVGYKWTIETNGTIIPSHICNIKYIVDYKLPSSGCCGSMNFQAFSLLKSDDFIKYVIMDNNDLDWAIDITKQLIKNYDCLARFAFSMANPLQKHSKQMVQQIVDRLLYERIDRVSLNLQLHKLLNLR